MSPLKFNLWSLTCSAAWRMPLHCSSKQIVIFTLWLHSPDQVLTINFNSPSSRATINLKCSDSQSACTGSVSDMTALMFDAVLSDVRLYAFIRWTASGACTFTNRHSNRQDFHVHVKKRPDLFNLAYNVLEYPKEASQKDLNVLLLLMASLTVALLATGVRVRANLGGDGWSPGRKRGAIWWLGTRGMGVILQVIKQSNEITASNWF